MPVPPEQLDEIAATVADVYREAEVALVRLIARHLKGDLDRDMPAPQWATEKLAAVRALRAGAQAVIAGLSASSEGAFRDAAARAYRSGAGSASAELPKDWFPKSGIGQQAARATFERMPGFGAVESLATAVHKDIGERSSNVLRDVLDAYRSVITATVARTVTGTATRREASQAAWRRLTDKGITSFTDRSGRRWQLSSYVEMAARTVTQRAAVQGQTDRLDALDVDLVMVSDHGQECVKCRPFEGKVLRTDSGPVGPLKLPHATRDGETVTVQVKATLQEARREGFQHPNCRHSVSAYLPGVSKLPDRDTADPEGDKARQKQRELERKIRAAKVAEVGALDEQAKKSAGKDVRLAQAALRAHLKANPKLKRLPYREQIGAGNIPPKGKNDPAGDIGVAVQTTLDGPAERIQRTPPATSADVTEAPRPADPDQLSLDDVAKPVDLAVLAKLSDDKLDERFAEATESGDEELLDAVLAEMDRRAERVDTPADDEVLENAAEWERFDALVAEGVDERDAYAEAFGKDTDRVRRDDAIARLRAAGHRGTGFDELARVAFRERLEHDYFSAEAATNGYLLTAEGQRAGINARDLWRNNEAFARRWASDELKEWWDQHGRVTFDEFSEGLLSGQGAARFRTGGETWQQ